MPLHRDTILQRGQKVLYHGLSLEIQAIDEVDRCVDVGVEGGAHFQRIPITQLDLLIPEPPPPEPEKPEKPEREKPEKPDEKPRRRDDDAETRPTPEPPPADAPPDDPGGPGRSARRSRG